VPDEKGNAPQKGAPNPSKGNDLGEEFDISRIGEGDGIDGPSFFENLDNQVNAGILHTPDEKAEMVRQQTSRAGQGEPAKSPAKTEKIPEGRKDDSDVETIKKRYSDSSREAKRLVKENSVLRGKVEEVESFEPIIEALKSDRGLRILIKDYYGSKGQVPMKSMKEALGLDEDFIYDPDEALSDPNSDSAKLLRASTNQIVAQQIEDYTRQLQEETVREQRSKEEVKFREKHNMTEEEWADFIERAKKTPMSLENMYALIYRDKRDKKISEDAAKSVAGQMQKTQGRPRSMATAGNAAAKSKTPDDMVMDILKGLDDDDPFGLT